MRAAVPVLAGLALLSAISATAAAGAADFPPARKASGPPPSLVQYPLPDPDAEPYDITTGPDGRMWYPYNFAGLLGRITTSGTITEFPIDAFLIFPVITTGADGNLWFLDLSAGAVDRITPRGTNLTRFPIPSGNVGPGDITLGPDGNVWFTDFNFNKIGRVTPAGVVTEFDLPEGSGPQGITAGPDGNVWFTDEFSNKIGRITPQGVITEFDAPGFGGPHRITLGPDGNLWYTKLDGGSIGRMTPGGVATEFVLPVGAQPQDITTGPDGNLWFTDPFNNRIGRITPAGQVGVFTLATPGNPANITTGPDGRLWFTMQAPARIGAFKPFVPKPSPPDVRSLTPPHTTTKGGTKVLITGYDVGAATQVLFGDTPAASFTVLGPGKILATAPPHAAGQVDVTVVTPAGTTAPAAGSRFFFSSTACGKVITRNTTLTADIGPCYDDGIVVGADNITLDLGGKRIFSFAAPSDGNAAGIRLPHRSGVVVRNGTVSGFDAGVVVNEGRGNTVNRLTVRDNIGPDDVFTANLGDGIVLLNAADNRIVDNRVLHNGVFDGIGVLGTAASGNTIQGNRVEDTVGPSDGGPAGQGIIVNAPGLDEGTGVPATHDDVVGNTVLRNASAGISNVNSTEAVIRENVVDDNGHTNRIGNGIGVQPGMMTLQPNGHVLVEKNVVRRNGEDGIQILSMANRIVANVSTDNDTKDAGYFDLVDTHPKCDSNAWLANVWGSAGFSPPCVTKGGSGPAPGPAATVQPPSARADDQLAPIMRRRLPSRP